MASPSGGGRSSARKRDRLGHAPEGQDRPRDARSVPRLSDTADAHRLSSADEGISKESARYRGLLEAAPDAMVVVNQAGEIVLLNLLAENQFGYRRDELVGQQVTNIIAEVSSNQLIQAVHRAIASQRATRDA